MNQLKDAKEHLKCFTHKEIITLLCIDCKILVCLICIKKDEKHFGHQFEEITKVKDKLKNLLSEKRDELKKNQNVYINNIEILKKEIEHIHKKSKELILEKTNEMCILEQKIAFIKLFESKDLLDYKVFLTEEYSKEEIPIHTKPGEIIWKNPNKFEVRWKILSNTIQFDQKSDKIITQTFSQPKNHLRMAFCGEEINQTEPFIIKVLIKTLYHWIGLGFARASFAKQNAKWTGNDKEECWIYSYNGFTWNENKNLNQDGLLQYTTGDIIIFEVDPKNKVAKVYNDDVFVCDLFFETPCVFCANLLGKGDTVEILDT